MPDNTTLEMHKKHLESFKAGKPWRGEP
jgi:hypothetical protein